VHKKSGSGEVPTEFTNISYTTLFPYIYLQQQNFSRQNIRYMSTHNAGKVKHLLAADIKFTLQ